MPLFNIEAVVTYRPKFAVDAPCAEQARMAAMKYLKGFMAQGSTVAIDQCEDLTPPAPWGRVVAAVQSDGSIEVTS